MANYTRLIHTAFMLIVPIDTFSHEIETSRLSYVGFFNVSIPVPKTSALFIYNIYPSYFYFREIKVTMKCHPVLMQHITRRYFL